MNTLCQVSECFISKGLILTLKVLFLDGTKIKNDSFPLYTSRVEIKIFRKINTYNDFLPIPWHSNDFPLLEKGIRQRVKYLSK